jgi:hypothetical protein
MYTCTLAGRNALCGRCGGMLGGIFESLDHFPLDGGADSRMGRVSQVLGGSFQSILLSVMIF